jgi:hypothetical protein
VKSSRKHKGDHFPVWFLCRPFIGVSEHLVLVVLKSEAWSKITTLGVIERGIKGMCVYLFG